MCGQTVREFVGAAGAKKKITSYPLITSFQLFPPRDICVITTDMHFLCEDTLVSLNSLILMKFGTTAALANLYRLVTCRSKKTR